MTTYLPPDVEKLMSIFFPHDLAKRNEVQRQNMRFVHYTSAEVAASIIQNKTIWMRNATTMNDFSEIQYGWDRLVPLYDNQTHGGRLKTFLDGLHTGFSQELTRRFSSWSAHFRTETYLTSLSEHDAEEDAYGRLSMWRAYGGQNGIALVINRHVFEQGENKLGAFSSPVAYLSPNAFADAFAALIDGIIAARDYVRGMDIEQLYSSIFQMLRFAILCTKHPGFAEEREWRIIYAPTYQPSDFIEKALATVSGIPQEIHKLPLREMPEAGVEGTDIPSLINRVIIGPSRQPGTLYRTFFNLLRDAGVDKPDERIVVSDIPLRQR